MGLFSALSVPLSPPTYCYFYIQPTLPDVILSSATITPLPFSDEVFVTSNLYILAKVSGIRGAGEKGVKTPSLNSDSTNVNSNYAIYANFSL